MAENLPHDMWDHVDQTMGLSYTLGHSIADLIDNSIDAKAKEVLVWVDTEEFPHPIGKKSDVLSFYVEDNGDGMDNPTESIGFSKRKGKKYGDADLGAFGVGLPSSTMSQGYEVTVFTKVQGESPEIRRFSYSDVCRKKKSGD